MKNTAALRQELKQKNKELKKAEREYNKQQLSEKLLCAPELILRNIDLSRTFLEMSSGEFKIILGELIASDKFRILIEDIIKNSTQLREFQEKKKVKAELRKLRTAEEQVASSEEKASEQFTACGCSKTENNTVDGDEISPSAEELDCNSSVNSAGLFSGSL